MVLKALRSVPVQAGRDVPQPHSRIICEAQRDPAVVTRVLSVAGVNRHLATFPAVQAAITGKRPDTGAVDARTASPDALPAHGPCAYPSMRARHVTGSGELHAAVPALPAHADA
jgi:hypothetical protein